MDLTVIPLLHLPDYGTKIMDGQGLDKKKTKEQKVMIS